MTADGGDPGVRVVSALAIERGDPVTVPRLLEAGVVIREGLDLSAVAPGRHALSYPPLLIEDGDGARARVPVRPI